MASKRAQSRPAQALGARQNDGIAAGDSGPSVPSRHHTEQLHTAKRLKPEQPQPPTTQNCSTTQQPPSALAQHRSTSPGGAYDALLEQLSALDHPTTVMPALTFWAQQPDGEARMRALQTGVRTFEAALRMARNGPQRALGPPGGGAWLPLFCHCGSRVRWPERPGPAYCAGTGGSKVQHKVYVQEVMCKHCSTRWPLVAMGSRQARDAGRWHPTVWACNNPCCTRGSGPDAVDTLKAAECVPANASKPVLVR